MNTYVKGDKVLFANGEDLKEGTVMLSFKQENEDMLVIEDSIGYSFFRNPQNVKSVDRLVKALRFFTTKPSVMGMFTPGTQKAIIDTLEPFEVQANKPASCNECDHQWFGICTKEKVSRIIGENGTALPIPDWCTLPKTEKEN
jgi:hypothetical protein